MISKLNSIEQQTIKKISPLPEDIITNAISKLFHVSKGLSLMRMITLMH